MWKRIRMMILVWIVLVSVGSLVFIGLFREFGDGRANYGEAFPHERYIRTHLDKPCAYHRDTPCTQEQLAEYHYETTVDFWLDIRDRLVPVILAALALLLLRIVVFIIRESRRGHIHADIGS